ncbi:ubiquitin carboxyl-terminal hydrolase 4 [Willisornis vidua]|uniref:Ubiquitin carboxyl-terminal hydrolase 4 n=1 Tax=Willisornis vidua TaxID=1566151 RepID=A0ABQ9DT48_9PASS|nr:ubiquitin carboxyl-terminal hydrolase 4 [Willisornis vidua]
MSTQTTAEPERKGDKSTSTMSTQTMTEPEGKRDRSTSIMSNQAMAEPEGKENRSTSTMSTQTVEEPEGQQKPLTVAPVQKRKSKTKSVHIVNDEEEEGSSHQAEETEPEIIPRSLSLGELHKLRREFTRQANESILTWLFRIWDTTASDTILDGSEARQLGSLSRDVVIDQGIGKRQETLSLWRRLLSSVRERYLCTARTVEDDETRYPVLKGISHIGDNLFRG